MPAPLTRTTDAANEPLSLAEAKAHLRVTHGDEDSLIESLIKAARQEAENRYKVSFITQTWKLLLDNWPASGVIELRRGPVSSVSSVKYYNTDGVLTTLVSGTDYQKDLASRPARVVCEPDKTWPSLETDRLNAVEVIYVAGYGADSTSLDVAIPRALLLIVGDLYLNREESAPVQLYQVPRAAAALLSHYGEVNA